MRRNVEIAAISSGRLRRRDRESVVDLSVSAATVRDGRWDGYATRYEEWTGDAPHPQLVNNVYLIDAEGAGLGGSALGQRAAHVRPGRLACVSRAVARGLRSGAGRVQRRAAPSDPSEQQSRFRDQRCACSSRRSASPVTRREPGSRPERDTVFGFTVIELDLPYIQQ